jgi:type II secretory pathway pseudopilin PulG
MNNPRSRRLHRSVAGIICGLLLAGTAATGLATVQPAWAAAGVSVTGPDGTATVSADYATEVTVSGSGFQAIQNGFGGVYVLFGWVGDAAGGSWKPSQGGVVGADYRYVPDAEAADNAGFQRFIAFPGSQTESSANGVLNADGSWSIGMVVPGANFESQDREGNVSAVDCLRVTCGIITIGAHGVKNANNETFTPLTFGSTAAAGGESASATPATAVGAVRLGVESTSVAAGTSIVFTGQGFTPGEQVVASLDAGLTAVGPLTAGIQGEVAAALPVPRDIRNGTHLVALRGAASGATAEAEVTVTGGMAVPATAVVAAETPEWVLVLMLVCIVIAAALVVASIFAAIARAGARRQVRRAAKGRAVADAVGTASPAVTRAFPESAQPATVEVMSAVAGPDDLTVAVPVAAAEAIPDGSPAAPVSGADDLPVAPPVAEPESEPVREPAEVAR